MNIAVTNDSVLSSSLDGYTEENIDINLKMPGAVEISQLELAQFKLAEDVTTPEYSETYLSRC